MNVFLSRQEILTPKLSVYGYELLFRDGLSNHAGLIGDNKVASAKVMESAFLEFDYGTMIGDRPAFLNVSRELLDSELLPSRTYGCFGLEILETEVVDDELISLVTGKAKQGYLISLDDFNYSESWQPLVELADIIKLDVLDLGSEGVLNELELLKNYSGKLLAEKVETLKEFNYYRSLGFDYFQGYFYAEPTFSLKKSIPQSKHITIKLLGELNRKEPCYNSIRNLIKQDARLSFKLLKLVNSPFYSRANRIDSLQEALVALGLVEIRRWITILTMSNFEDAPDVLIFSSVFRGNMCKNIAISLDKTDPEAYFTVGLFSHLEALLGMSYERIFDQMNLSELLVKALVKQENEMGVVLNSVINFEQGKELSNGMLDLPESVVNEAYISSLKWAEVVYERIG